MNKQAARKALKTILIAVPALLLALVLFILAWVGENELKDYRQYFEDNQQELTAYADAFLEQDTIRGMSRARDIVGVSYHIVVMGSDAQDTRISFIVPFWDNLFWPAADISKIKDLWSYPEQTLGSFLEENDVSKEEFLKWRGFLARHDFLSIGHMHGKEGRGLEIDKTSWCGFEYRKGTDVRQGYGPYVDVLNSHWLYQSRHGIDGYLGK